MAVLSAFRDGVSVLQRNPVILVVGVAIMAIQQVSSLGEFTESFALIALFSLVGFGITIVVWPFFLAGILGMALEGLEGATTLDRFLEVGKQRYVSMLGAQVLFIGLMIALFIAVFFVSAIATIAFGIGFAAMEFDAGRAPGRNRDLRDNRNRVLSRVLRRLHVPAVFDAAIVVEGERAFDAFGRSIHVVRSNLLSVVGYTLLWGTVNVAMFTPVYVTEFAVAQPGLQLEVSETMLRAAAIGLTVVVGGLIQAYLYTVHAAYYAIAPSPLHRSGQTTELGCSLSSRRPVAEFVENQPSTATALHPRNLRKRPARTMTTPIVDPTSGGRTGIGMTIRRMPTAMTFVDVLTLGLSTPTDKTPRGGRATVGTDDDSSRHRTLDSGRLEGIEITVDAPEHSGDGRGEAQSLSSSHRYWESMHVIGTVGLPGSGKGEAATVAREEGIPVVTMGDVVRQETADRGLDPAKDHGTVAQALREENGPAAIAERSLPMIEDRLESHDTVQPTAFARTSKSTPSRSASRRPSRSSASRPLRRSPRAYRYTGRDAGEADGGEGCRPRRARAWLRMDDAMDRADVVVENTDTLEAFHERIRSIIREGETSDAEEPTEVRRP